MASGYEGVLSADGSTLRWITRARPSRGTLFIAELISQADKRLQLGVYSESAYANRVAYWRGLNATVPINETRQLYTGVVWYTRTVPAQVCERCDQLPEPT